MLTTILALKAVTEIALLSLLAQWALGWLSGPRKGKNLLYQTFQLLGRPFVRVARWVSPPVVLDRHVPLVAFLMLAFAWLLLTWAKVGACLQTGVNTCT